MIVSWAIENNLVYFRVILVRSVVVIVSCAIENNLVYNYGPSGLACDYDSFLGCGEIT